MGGLAELKASNPYTEGDHSTLDNHKVFQFLSLFGKAAEGIHPLILRKSIGKKLQLSEKNN